MSDASSDRPQDKRLTGSVLASLPRFIGSVLSLKPLIGWVTDWQHTLKPQSSSNPDDHNPCEAQNL